MRCFFGGPESKRPLLVTVTFFSKMTDLSHSRGGTPAMPGIRGGPFWCIVTLVFHVLLRVPGVSPRLRTGL